MGWKRSGRALSGSIILALLVLISSISMVSALKVDTSVDDYEMIPGAASCGGFVVSNTTGGFVIDGNLTFLRVSDDIIVFDDNYFVPYQVIAHENISYGDYYNTIEISEGNDTVLHTVELSVESQLSKNLGEAVDQAGKFIGVIYIVLAVLLLVIVTVLFKIVTGGKS